MDMTEREGEGVQAKQNRPVKAFPVIDLCWCGVQVLKAERPDVDEKRSDLLKLQGRCFVCAWL